MVNVNILKYNVDSMIGGIDMPYSVYNDELEFSEHEWVVSLINTKKGLDGMLGGHAKIVVEGIRRNASDLFATELFIAEYHIMEAEAIPIESWIPQALRNTHCRYIVAWREENRYTREREQYRAIQARSCGALVPSEVMRMIENIKQEQHDITTGEKIPNFQYAGEFCFYSYKGGHNCTTWVEEKLRMIGADEFLFTDIFKASPSSHTSSSAGSSSSCKIL